MGKKYPNPPIVEALCEFQFISETPWNDAFHELLYEKIKDNFPTKQEQTNFGIGIEIKQESKSVEYKPAPAIKRMQFFNENKTALIQISPNILTINQLKPYPNWDKFKPAILDNLEKYRNIANPIGFRQIGLRYINKIDINIKEKDIKVKDYFNFFPHLPEDMSQDHGMFNMQIEIPHGKDRLVLIFGTIMSGQQDVISFILDLGYNINILDEIKFENIDEYLDKAHQNIEDTFEACITKKSQELFGNS